MKRSFLSTYRPDDAHFDLLTGPELFDSALVGFVRWDEGGRLMAANRQFCNLAGIERKSLEHGTFNVSTLVPEVDWQTSGIQERTIVRGGVAHAWRIEVSAAARQAFLVDVTAQHAAEKALANARDLLEAHAAAITGTASSDLVSSTRLLDAQTQLERQQIEIEELLERVADAHHELESFSYSVSHDLRTPLRALDGFSRELLERHADGLHPNARHYVARIRAGAQKLDRIVDDLLRLARVGRTAMNIVRTDLAPIARAVAAELSAASPDRRVRWIIPDHVFASADRELITLVLQNLMENAWKFASNREEVRIELRVDGTASRPIYSVCDDGEGFDMRYADKLFAPFQRLHGAEFLGTGIGLATVKRIIHRHNGQVWAESAPGNGATFSFVLGRAAEGKP